ncbi:MAG: hypothetical protein IPK06_03805 [Ignavibacteriae bacterium]|nr:hypothetical protein [Ignavibacteriota bacterium]
MKNKKLLNLIFIVQLIFTINVSASLAETDLFEIVISESASSIEKNIAYLLEQRLNEKGLQNVEITTENNSEISSTNLILGIPKSHKILKQIFYSNRLKELSELEPGSEGFLLKSISSNPNIIIIAGVDERGCLYGVGEFLRKIQVINGAFIYDKNLSIRTAPAFEIRGTQFGQSYVAKNLAKVRDWTEEETKRVILDYALAGANIFNVDPGPMFNFIKSFGLMTQGGFGANTAGEEVPAEWNASESIGRLGYICPSVHEAREFMLKKCEDYFKNSPTFDLVKFHGGDGGGCECDKCNPYGLTFIKLVEDMANIIHKYHPTSRIYFTNQKFDNEDDFAIFNYLQEKPRTWLWAWGYGPGSDATSWQPGHRQTHRMDLFKYPGFGPYGLYPQEILHQLPPQQKLVFYNEITHWKYAQHGYVQMYPRADKNGDQPPHWSEDIYERRPDQYLTMVYNRLTFYAWPKYYHRVFNDLMRYGIGDITHSSGHHDHFNQWMWQRLLWSPRMSVEDVVNEYCKNWFGEEAAPFMAKAIFQLEENLEENPEIPLDKKEGIDNYYDLVKNAGVKIPQSELNNNWLWQMYMQKAALDKYIKLKVAQQKELETQIENNVIEIISDLNLKEIDKQLKLFDDLHDTKEMLSLKQEAKELGELSNKTFGERNEGFYNLDHDYIGLGWLKRQLERAVKSKDKIEKVSLLKMIADYENPGDSGFYDNLGTFNKAPNVVVGYPYDHGQPYLNDMLDEGNRPSQRSMHFTQDEEKGVTLEYRDLDTNANYTVRFTFVRPWYQPRYNHRMNQKSQTIYADEIVLAKELEVPFKMSDFFTFKVPRHATKDGKLIIRLEKAHDTAIGDRVSIEQWRNSGGWGTIVSEVWLMKD